MKEFKVYFTTDEISAMNDALNLAVDHMDDVISENTHLPKDSHIRSIWEGQKNDFTALKQKLSGILQEQG